MLKTQVFEVRPWDAASYAGAGQWFHRCRPTCVFMSARRDTTCDARHWVGQRRLTVLGPVLKPPMVPCLKLQYDELLSKVAFILNLRHYNWVCGDGRVNHNDVIARKHFIRKADGMLQYQVPAGPAWMQLKAVMEAAGLATSPDAI